MQDLQLIGVHEDGEHLLFSGADDSRFVVPVDEALRAAIRRDRPHLGQQQTEADGGLRPRDVQALIRAGASTDEAASRAGWTVEKVHRYEGPILAEREHVAGLAQQARLRTRNGVSSGVAPTLSARVAERLKSRDVEVTDTSWDSWRAEGGPWTVVLTFAAGGRQRQASWSFDLADRTVSAVDDEARWLSEEVQTAGGPIPAPPRRPSPGRDTTVYDVEAEGGLHPVSREDHQDDPLPLDLMSAMRRRSSARGRRRPGAQGSSPTTDSPTTDSPTTDSAETESPKTDLAETVSPTTTPRTDSPGPGSPQGAPGAPGAVQHPLEPLEPPLEPLEPLGETLPLQDLGYDAEMAPLTAEADAYRDPSRTALDQEQDKGQPESGAATGIDAGHGAPLADREPGEVSPDESSRAEASPDDTDEVPERSTQRSQTKARKRPREAARKTGRPSVPAWDEIMFGSRPGADRSSS